MCLTLLLGALLLKIAYLDYKYLYIADRDILLGIALSLGQKYLAQDFVNGILGLALGFASAGLVYVIARVTYKDTAFGSGDVTLALFLGSIVGARGFGSWALFFSLLFLVGSLPLFLTKKLSWSTTFPLAPFLNLATILWLVWQSVSSSCY